jgi:acetyl esterase/lipase
MMQDPALLEYPLVSPILLPDLTGFSKQGMLVVAGGAELMRPDIASFAAKAKAAGEFLHPTKLG